MLPFHVGIDWDYSETEDEWGPYTEQDTDAEPEDETDASDLEPDADDDGEEPPAETWGPGPEEA